MIYKLPIIQRTKDGMSLLELTPMYFHINEDCFKRVDGVASKITPEQFRVATKGEELETFDMEMSK